MSSAEILQGLDLDPELDLVLDLDLDPEVLVTESIDQPVASHQLASTLTANIAELS